MSVEGGNFTDRAKETTRFLKNGSPRSSCRPHDDMTAAREPPTAQDIVFHISKTVMTKSTNTILKGIRHALDTGMLMYEMRTLLLVLLLSTTMAAALAASVDELQARRKAARFLASKGVGMPKTAKTTRAGVSVNAAVPFGQRKARPSTSSTATTASLSSRATTARHPFWATPPHPPSRGTRLPTTSSHGCGDMPTR